MVSYEFYTQEYNGGSVSKEHWPALVQEASAKLNQYKRRYTVIAPEENSEAMAICAMVETLDYFEIIQSGNIAVQSVDVGSVSVTYDNAAKSVDISPKSKEAELYRAARLYLDICRGVG